MASKNEKQRLEETFEFALEHTDIVNMMNDEDVDIDNGNVEEDQVFEIMLEKSNGSQIYLRDLSPTDKVVFRFVRVTDTDDSGDFDTVDVE